MQARRVDLAERCRGERLALEVREQLVGVAPELGPHHLGDLRELHPLRRLGEQPRDHAARFLGQRVGIHRERLPELERRALELPEGGEGSAVLAYCALLVGMLAIGAPAQQHGLVEGLWITEALAIALPAAFVLGVAGIRFAPWLGLRRVSWKHVLVAVGLAAANQPVV